MPVDKGVGTEDIQQIIAGMLGAVAGTDWKGVKTFAQGAVRIITGTACATYLTPLIAQQLTITDFKYMLGLSFLMGTLGMKSVHKLTTVLDAMMTKVKSQ
jgi:hypothetical protein